MGRQRESYRERLRKSSLTDKELTAQVSDRSRPVEGCADGLISKCDGTYRAKLTWSDDDCTTQED